jgi:hypothetical protein
VQTEYLEQNRRFSKDIQDGTFKYRLEIQDRTLNRTRGTGKQDRVVGTRHQGKNKQAIQIEKRI